jgi:hypothetical protein
LSFLLKYRSDRRNKVLEEMSRADIIKATYKLIVSIIWPWGGGALSREWSSILRQLFQGKDPMFQKGS